jgi:hypothetical protein
MNRAPSHLSLEELIAAARGEPLAPPAAGHLATCRDCAGEFRTWNAVAGGIRLLVTQSTPPGRVIGQVLAAIDDEPPQPGPMPSRRAVSLTGPARHGLRGHRHAWLAAAAAVALLAGGGYGVSRLLSSAASSHASTQADAALAATGCSSLKATGGTLTSVNGSTLTIRAADGSSVTVTTSGNTKVAREVAGTLGDITDGTPVAVFGTDSGGTIHARSVALRNQAASSLGKLPASPAGGGPSLRLGLASGTVTDATGSGFTVDEAGGSRVQVTTSSATTVLTLVTSSIGKLKTGELTSAVGAPGPDGTLAATMVEQDAVTTSPAPPSPPQGLPSGLPSGLHSGLPSGLPTPGHGLGSAFPSPPARPSPGNLGSLFSGLGCSQDAITTTYLMSLASQEH